MVSINSQRSAEDGDDSNSFDVAEAERHDDISIDLKQLFAEGVCQIDKIDRAVWLCKYQCQSEHTDIEIANWLGVERSTVTKRFNKVRAKFLTILEQMGYDAENLESMLRGK